jgi:NAD(P)-dependent dehydrogenase (short-subunit alcohol dehydrogenase family)
MAKRERFMSHVSGKTVIITGASRGIGAAAARLFAEQGAHVVLAARSREAISAIAAQIVEQGGQASAYACDVSDYGAVCALIAHAKGVFGSVDVLINNAGLIDPIARLADSDPESWAQVVDVNYKGVYYGLRAALPEMLDNASGGTVINISSGAATGALEGWSHYCSTKAAVLSLTRCADQEYRDQGIKVMGLRPGTVATDMQASIKESGINPVSQLDQSVHIPAEWVAKALVYLCGPDGQAYVGSDFYITTPEARAALGLPAP